MPRDFVKRPDREFAAQVAQFLARLASVKDELGLPDDWEAQLLAGHSAFVAALEAVDRARASLHSAVQAKDALREQVEREWRGLVRQLRAHPDFGDAHAASLGLPVRDRVRTPIEPGAEVPTLEIQIQPLRLRSTSGKPMQRAVGAASLGGRRQFGWCMRLYRLASRRPLQSRCTTLPARPLRRLSGSCPARGSARTSGIVARGRRRVGRGARGQTLHGQQWRGSRVYFPAGGEQ